MPQFTPKRYEAILQQIIARVVTRSGLVDVNDVGVSKNLCAATARQLDECYYQMSLLLQLFNIDTATGADLDARAQDIQPATLTRLAATQATGAVVFSAPAALAAGSSITIPTGTQVKTSGGLIYLTSAVGTITSTNVSLVSGVVGRDSGLVPVVAQLPGSTGNVAAGTVAAFVSKPAGIATVTNLTAFTQGQNQETDDAFRARLKNYIAGLARSTPSALKSAVLGAQDPVSGDTILFASVDESSTVGYVTVYIDDGTGAAASYQSVTGENLCYGIGPSNAALGGETRLYFDNKPLNMANPPVLTSSTRGLLTSGVQYNLNPASSLVVLSPALVTGEVITANYYYYTGLIQLAQKIIDGDPTNPTAYPGYRAAGVLVLAATPQVLITTVNATLTIANGYNATTVESAAQTAVLNYVNGLSISGDVIRAALFQAIMAVPGVTNVSLTTPTADIIILDNQLARTQLSNVVIN